MVKKLNSNDIKVNVIAIDFFHEVEDEEDSTSLKRETKNQSETADVLRKLMEGSDNIKVFTAKMASQIYKQFRKKKVNPVAKFRGPLVLTPSLYLDVAVYAKTAKENLPSLKKYSLAAEFSEDSKQGGITNDKVYYVNDDPDQNPLPTEFVTKAYNYGNSLVPVSKQDEILFKNQEAKILKSIGFTDSFRVPRHFFLGGVDIVIPNPEVIKEIEAFTALVQEMIRLNKVLICRYVYRNNSDPKLVVLTPHISKKGAVLYLNILPTIEDIRDYQFESLKECTVKQEEIVSKFIDSLDLEKEDEDGETEEKLKPTQTYNPVLQHFYQCVEHKALKKENNLPNLDEMIGDYLKPDKKLFENNKYVSFMPKVFDIKEKEQKEDKKKRVFWREMIKSEIQEETGVSDKRLEEKLEAHKEEAKEKISPTRAIEDFKEMINFKYRDLTVQAIEQMKEIIVKFILESFKGSYYIKAMDCLKVVREACIDDDEVDLFNNFMEKLLNDFPKEKFMDWWRLIVDNRITLISDRENIKSGRTEAECNEWLSRLSKKEVITSTLKDLDDLIADID